MVEKMMIKRKILNTVGEAISCLRFVAVEGGRESWFGSIGGGKIL